MAKKQLPLAIRRKKLKKLKGRVPAGKPGTTFTKVVEKGPNKGDTVTYKVAKGGKPYAVRLLKDKKRSSTLRDNEGIQQPGQPKRKPGRPKGSRKKKR